MCQHLMRVTWRVSILQCWLNTLRPRQNGRHFAYDTLKCIFLKENVKISIKISLKLVPRSPIDNIPALFQIKWLDADQATSHYLKQWWLGYRRIYASLGLNELTHWGRNILRSIFGNTVFVQVPVFSIKFHVRLFPVVELIFGPYRIP